MVDRGAMDGAGEARVRRLLRATTRLVDPSSELYAEALAVLPAETGLSREGVALAMRCAVEREASDDEMARLLASVRPAARVVVVLAGNVFAAAVRAVALGWASAPVVRLRPSRRAPAMARLVARAVAATPGPGALELLDPGSSLQADEGDTVHAYGSDATLAAIGRELGPAVPLWGHGHGVGVLVGAARAASLVPGAPSLDIALFDQQGCLSPRLALVVGDESEAVALAGRAAHAMGEATREVPAGPMSTEELAARRGFIETLRAVGEVRVDGELVVGHLREPDALLWPGFARGLLVASYARVDDAVAALGPLALTSIGAWGPLPEGWRERFAAAAPGARWTVAGRMQRPPLDGPVDLRTPCP